MNEQRMIGHYKIIDLLGTGAMGTVHVALDTFIERPVAIKSLRPELTQDPDFVSRFRAEAKSLARLNHPNVATLYSPLLEGTDLYMVMELVRGRPLDEILRDRGKPLGVKESLAIVAQAADGLSYAHEMGVIHRDIKPSNLMIANDGRIKIMDFGIARVRGSVRLTRTGTAVGTPLYMSPEQCRGGEGDERSDLYSLAIVLYEMLSGAPPFSGATEYELIQAQIGKAPPPLIPKAQGVTPQIEAAIMRALAKKPEQRFASVRAFSDAVGATVMRLDASGVVRNAAYLVEAAQNESDGQKISTSAFDVARSRTAALTRGLKAQPLAVRGGAVVGLISAMAAFAYIMLVPPNNSLPNSRLGAPLHADGTMKNQKNAGDEAPSVDEDRPSSGGSGSDNNTKLKALRQAIKGSSTGRIRASDFDFVSNDMKDQLLGPAKSLAAAGIAEAQFVLGMLLLETQGHIDIEGAFNALTGAANQNYPDAQVNLAMLYQNGMLSTGRDLVQASYWLRQAAENGNAKAQFWLGCYYQYGWGGHSKDTSKASEQYARASAANYALANEAIEVMTGASKATTPCAR